MKNCELLSIELENKEYVINIDRIAFRKSVTLSFKNNQFFIRCPLMTPKKFIIDFVSSRGASLIKRSEKTKHFLKNGVYILGEFQEFNDGFIRVLNHPILYVDQTDFYKRCKTITYDYFLSRLRKYEQIMLINNPYSLKIRYTKTKYGHNDRKNHIIQLSPELIHYSEEIIDSVIIHELSHHYVYNHSNDFYNVLYRYCPNYDNLRKKLIKGEHQ